MGTMLPYDFDEDDIEVSWEDVHQLDLREQWSNGYDLGYATGKLQAHTDLIITMMENLIAAGVPYWKALSFMAMAFQVGEINIESLLPANFKRENPENTKSY